MQEARRIVRLENALGFCKKQSMLEQVVANEEWKYYSAAANALEKQIPKKVHFHHSREKGICPNCLSVEDTSANYCRCCGQLLDFDIAHPTEKGGVEE